MGEGDLGCGSNDQCDPSPLPSSPLGTRKYARDAGTVPRASHWKGVNYLVASGVPDHIVCRKNLPEFPVIK